MINYDDIKDDIKAEIKNSGYIFTRLAYLGKKIAWRDNMMMLSLVLYLASWIPMLFNDSYDMARMILTVVYNCIYWPILVSSIRLKKKTNPIRQELRESMKRARELMDKHGLDMEDLD